MWFQYLVRQMALTVTLVFALYIALGQQPDRKGLKSHINIITPDGQTKKEIFSSTRHFEAPNWSRDGSYLLLNSEGKLWRMGLGGGDPPLIPTGAVDGINNDHGFSPDGKWIAISAKGHIYILPSSGGEPRRLTENTPSYFHVWSPDGKTLVYCARRQGNFDIYSISIDGGAEKRLTTHPGYDDGPDYSPDGKWIYFNSDRSGSWDIWRIPAEGAGVDDRNAEHVTDDEFEDWFPHPSPDGKWLVFLSYIKGTKGHPPNQNVRLRIMPLPGAKINDKIIREITRLFGGQGTINVPSWSPDSKHFAYVSYSLLK